MWYINKESSQILPQLLACVMDTNTIQPGYLIERAVYLEIVRYDDVERQ